MSFKGDIQETLRNFSTAMSGLALVNGVGGVVLAVAYRDQDAADPTDEVAMVIVPKNAELEKRVCQLVVEGLQAHLSGAESRGGGEN